VSGSVHSEPVRIELVVVAGSAGVVPLYREIFGRLDQGLPAAVLFVQHRASGEDVVCGLLKQRTRLDVRVPSDGERLRPGTLYVCPSAAQLRVAPGGEVALDPLADGASVRADVVLASAAAVYGPTVLAVVLSGRLQDGTAGVRAVKQAAGRVIVQDPRTAAHSSMPVAALATGCVDYCLPPPSIADAIASFAAVPGAAALFAARAAPWASHVADQRSPAETRRPG
jgi:two-component system chemotaxis response regulator CheB